MSLPEKNVCKYGKAIGDGGYIENEQNGFANGHKTLFTLIEGHLEQETGRDKVGIREMVRNIGIISMFNIYVILCTNAEVTGVNNEELLFLFIHTRTHT